MASNVFDALIMLDHVYAYIMAPARTIQLHRHTRQWAVWCIIIGVSALLSIIRWSSVGVVPWLAHAMLCGAWLVMVSVIVDASAQWMGCRSQLPSTIYWMGFAGVVRWLSPSVDAIQSVWPGLGALVLFGLNGVFLYYVAVTLTTIYGLTRWQVAWLVSIPLIAWFRSV